ncbi:MAG: serine/threonine protein kinase, partial [Lachnospiraceae bacterium]|nr:serine/threonine protein kinase [Lachnospiraceae bacterium]
MIRKGMFIGDRYEIIDKVGSGGISDVYKALDHNLNRYVDVKVLKDEFSEDKSFVSKFKVEAQSAAGLAHPNIVNVFDVGEENGIYFIVMELVEGITLKKYIEKKGKLPIKEAVSIAIQIAQGIEAAHNNHIIHRDIKPQNVIISREGKVKVTDFGIARAASANTINSNAMGSVHYISPEQARGGYIDEKSDIYSLGISLYEMITGKVPFEGDSTVTIALQHINEELPSPKIEAPDLPISVEKIIEKCTQKKAERRYLKVSTLIADLKKSLITPDEDFVVMTPVANNNATIMITDEDISIIRKGATGTMAAASKDDDSAKRTSADKNDEYDIDDDIDATNPKFDKVITIGAIVASVVVLIVVVLVFVNVLKKCDNSQDDPYEKQTTEQEQT